MIKDSAYSDRACLLCASGWRCANNIASERYDQILAARNKVG